MKKHEYIHCNGNIGMQRMKVNAAPAMLKNRYGQQMIKIHQHSNQENNIGLLPGLPEENKCDERRENKMQ